jgi:hypothetical protein
VRKLVTSLAVVAAFALLACSVAQADSATVTAVDAGGGQMTATVTATSTSCTTFGYCGWFTSVVERYSSLPCVSDETFIRGVQPLQEKAGTLTSSFTFRPFFPRSTKLCVIMTNPAGVASVGEAVIALPSGYGYQRSTAYNCSNFSSHAAAQYYLELYPSDPSRLDGDHDGSACEDNKCPCSTEPIPPEPEVVTTPVVAPTTTSPPATPVVPVQVPVKPVKTPPPAECVSAKDGERRALQAVNNATRFLRGHHHLTPSATQRWKGKLRKANRRRTLDERWVEDAC